MAEIIDQNGKMHDVASNSKANAGLTTGIIGTALSGLLALGGMGCMLGGKGRNGYGWDGCPGYGGPGLVGPGYGFGFNAGTSQALDMTNEDLYIERKQAQNFIDVTKEYYQGRLTNLRELTDAFFQSYKRDVDLYKSQRDMFDIATKEAHHNYDKLNQKIIDSSFGLYKNQRDEKDILMSKINGLENRINIMSAIRPYQDALINAKIDNNALMSDFKLGKRTCRMIEGQLVLPNTPEVTGYTSYQSVCPFNTPNT